MKKIIATSEFWEFWQIGTEVDRCRKNEGLLDTWGPMGKRWECSIAHWERYRDVFGWATDVPGKEEKNVQIQ